MNIILLSGGSGKRLWPLSNEIRSKQFIKIFQNETGDYESMVQRVYGQIKRADPDANITIATSKNQVSSIKNQLGNNVNLCVEPDKRDTFAAIALSSVFLNEIQGVSPDESVVVCPVDSYVEDHYFKAVQKLCHTAQHGDSNLYLLGISPSYPSEKYGYIIPANQDDISPVLQFQEKPDVKTAQTYIQQGALWNAGVFSFRLDYLLEKAHENFSFVDYQDLLLHYKSLQKISFDYGVVEKESKINVMRYAGEWKDLGTWNTLSEAMQTQVIGEAMLNKNCENVNIINELDVPILCMGLKNMVVSASAEGILVSDKAQSSYIKPFVDTLDRQIMFAEKSWGSFRVIDVDEQSLTIKVILNPKHSMNYHRHAHRHEVWTVVEGEGKVVLDGAVKPVNAGDIIRIPIGVKHTIYADTLLKIIEVQHGDDLSVEDKEKFSMCEELLRYLEQKFV